MEGRGGTKRLRPDEAALDDTDEAKRARDNGTASSNVEQASSPQDGGAVVRGEDDAVGFGRN